jgi:hypothetical protein
MPVKVTVDGKEKWIKPQTTWEQEDITIGNQKLEIDKNFYVAGFDITE